MLSLALATIRTRWASFVGAFLALALGTGLIAMMLLTLFATFGTPHHGPQRFATATVVVAPQGPLGAALPAPAAIPADVVARAVAAGPVVLDRTFDAQLLGGPSGSVGHGWSSAAFAPYRLTAGRAPAADGEIVIGGGTADLIGRQVKVAVPAGRQTFTVVGTTSAQWFENAVFFTDAEAARLSPAVNALVSDRSVDAVRQALGSTSSDPQPVLLTGDDRRQVDPDPSGGAALLSGTQAMAGTTTCIAVFVAGFIVVATFAFTVEQRRRELALLRLVGATPEQVWRMVITESALLGVAAAAVGCVLGPLGADTMNHWLVDRNMAPPWFHIGTSAVAMLLAFASGLVAALAGAASVALRAARIRPVEALREAAADNRVITPLRLLLGVGLLLSAVAVGGYVSVSTPTYAINPRKYVMVPLLFTGAFALLAPIVLPPVARLVTWPLSRFGAGSLLIRQNLLTARRRTASTVAPVVVAVGLVATMLCTQTTGDQSKVAQARAATHADLTVVPQGTGSLDRSTLTALASVPGVRATAVTPTTIMLGGPDGMVMDGFHARAVDPAAMGSVLTPRLVSGSLLNLGDDFLVLDHKAAQQDDLEPGSQVTAWLPDGTRTVLRVAAVAETGLGADAAYLSSAHAAGGRPDQAWVQVLPGTDAATADRALAAAIQGQAARYSTVSGYFDTLKLQEKQQNQSASTVVLGVSVLYALISVANTLAMAAAGRRRELAALNLAGATRGQSLRVIAGESALAVVVGALLAAMATAAVLATQWTTLVQFVSSVPFGISWTPVAQATALCAAIAVGVSVLSAWWITRRRSIEVASLRE